MPDRLQLDAKTIAVQIDALLASFPDMADDDELRADMIDGETDFSTVMSRALNREREARAMVEAIKARTEDLTERRRRFERRIEAMRSLMLSLMSAADQTSVVLPEATISMAKGRETVEVTDVDALPQGTYRTVRQPDKATLLNLLKSGEQIPGAALATGDVTLSVRSK